MPSPTPSSLKWLINKQTRLNGCLASTESKRALLLSQVEALTAEIAEVTRQLKLIEGAMSLHDIRIDPADLRPIRPMQKCLMKNGGLSRAIFEALADLPDRKATTPDILQAVLSHLPCEPSLQEYLHIRSRLQVRLCVLADQGRLIRHITGHRKMPRVWELATTSSDGT